MKGRGKFRAGMSRWNGACAASRLMHFALLRLRLIGYSPFDQGPFLLAFGAAMRQVAGCAKRLWSLGGNNLRARRSYLR